MANEIIQIGNKIEMYEVSRNHAAEDDPVVYISQFLQWLEHNVALIAVPFHQNHLVPLRYDIPYEMRFFTKKGLYRCRGVVQKRTKTGNNIAVAEVKFISALEKQQRRQYYRMDCILPMKYSILKEIPRDTYQERKKAMSLEDKLKLEEKLKKRQLEMLEGTILDLSGGGIRFNSLNQQTAGDVLLLCPSIPEHVWKKIPLLLGKVISCRKIPNKEPAMFDNRIEFVEVTHMEQEQIITYIFQEERERRRREAEIK